jgi:GTP-binding protein
MLIDDVKITIKAGKGGNGAISFRHDEGKDHGGPDGGNGGYGGDVYVIAVDDMMALRQFQFKKQLKADDGVPGKRKNLFGRKGEDLLLKVPRGTQITDIDSGRTIEIVDRVTPVRLATGGIGGRGNNEFKTSTIQAPRYAEDGTPGEEKHLHIQLKIIADIGFIGLPNAGKSSLLGMLTNANPKIGAYPFTTLEPNLGAMGTIIMADIPGLIEGAHEGRGLGIKFLKHIEKTKLLFHCIDVTTENILETYELVRREFAEYKTELLEKPEIILLTKTDLVDAKTIADKKKLLKKTKREIHTVSVYDDKSLEELKNIIETNVLHIESK